jgi:superfamily II DNA or RNA helicase
MSADFTDQLEHSVSARRLRAAIEVDAGWIEPMVQDAHQMLLTTRKEHPDAGGLVVGVDHHHVRKLAQLLLKITGEKPVVVLSDDKEASGKIKLFSESKQPWIVACNMVSEGVDIPRLRVGVYATAVRTKMYFRQFLGRIVRKLPTLPGLQVAYLYLPADPLLRGYAEEIESETRHQLRALSEAVEVERTRQERAEARRLWEPLQAVNSGVEAVIVHGNQLSLFGSGTTVSPEQVLEVVKEEVHLNLQEKLTRSERKSELAAEIKRIVGIIHRKSGHSHSAIHTTLNRAQGVRSQTHCTEDQLRERIELLHAMTTVRGATLTVPRRAPRGVSE